MRNTKNIFITKAFVKFVKLLIIFIVFLFFFSLKIEAGCSGGDGCYCGAGCSEDSDCKNFGITDSLISNTFGLYYWKTISSEKCVTFAVNFALFPVQMLDIFQCSSKIVGLHAPLSQLPIVVPLQPICASIQSQVTPALPSCGFNGK